MIDGGIIACIGGGGFSEHGRDSKIDDAILALAESDTPRICYVPTAGGDSEPYIERFIESFSDRGCTPSVLRLFRREVADIEAFLCEHDIIYVGGGNTANMLAIWRVHGVDRALRAAYARGTILSGVSAGMNCWYEGSITDSFDEISVLDDGLGLLPGIGCPHFDSEPERSPAVDAFVASDGRSVVGIDEDAAVIYHGGVPESIVTDSSGHSAWIVEHDAATDVSRRQLMPPDPAR